MILQKKQLDIEAQPLAKFQKKVINGLARIFRTNERTNERTELMKTIVLPEKSRGTNIDLTVVCYVM